MFDDIFCHRDVGGKYVHAPTIHQHTNDIKYRWIQCVIGFLLKWPHGPTLCRTTECNNTYINIFTLHIFIYLFSGRAYIYFAFASFKLIIQHISHSFIATL